MLIKNARVIDCCLDEKLDVYIRDGKIYSIGKNIKPENNNEEIIDAEGKILMPAFIDLHCHFRDPGFEYKEDLITGSYAALKGGYGTVNLMGNTKPTVDSIEVYRDIVTRARELNLIHIEQVMNVTKGISGEELIDFEKLSDDIKFLSDDGKGVMSNKLMLEAMKKAKEKNIGIMVHAEDMEISPYDYRIAEDIITLRDIYLAGKTDCNIHFSHVSTEDSINAIKLGKSLGYNITCEVTPHHIYLSDIDYKVNPPIRDKKDIEVLIERIKDGTIDCIATDHAPHSQEDKEKGACGMVGLETAFNICYEKLILENHITLNRLSELMSLNPARILDLNKGKIIPGYDADLVIIDLNKEVKVDDDYFNSKSKNSPFKGKKFTGEIVSTICNGKVKYRKDDFNDSRSFI